VSYDAYMRRNHQATAALRNSGMQADTESLAGGYYGVHVPLEGGYHLSVAQDLDGDKAWSARVEHGSDREPVTGIDSGNPGGHDVEMGHFHPRDMPTKVHQALQGPVMQKIKAHMAAGKPGSGAPGVFHDRRGE
jgi:hypothetical protein